MTTSEVDRLARMLADIRVEQAGQFARLDERLKDVPTLDARLTSVEERVTVNAAAAAQAGRFGWSEVFKAAAAAAAVVAIYHSVSGV